MNQNRSRPTEFAPRPKHPWFIQLNKETADRIYDDCVSVSHNLAAPFKKLNNEIEDYYYENVQSREEFEAKVQLRDIIAKILQSSSNGRDGWPKSLVVITGSSITGLASKDSDLDLCVAIPDVLDHFPTKESDAARTCVKIMEHRLVEDKEFFKLIVKEKSGDLKMRFVDASIPVLKMEVLIDGFKIECDLSASCNREGFVSSLHNSFLLRHYVIFDRRVGPLCFFIKQWAKNFEIYNPIDGRINSYCLTLLVIHYLQCGLDPPILPNFIQNYPTFFASSEQDFPRVVDFDLGLPWELENQEINQLNMGNLFYGFISYYSEFNFKKLRIDMKEGCVKQRQLQCGNYENPRILDIRDPIDRHNPGRTLRQDGLEYIKVILGGMREVFQNAAKTTNGVDSPDCLPPFQVLLGNPDAYGN